MRRTTIRFGLSEAGISRAIKELEQYQDDFSRRIELLRKRVAERIGLLAQSGFSGAVVDDRLEESGGARFADVVVSVSHNDALSVVIAQGEDAVWVEFGAGVYHNGGVGTSPNPNGAALGFTIGGFGTNGSKEIWGFYEGGVKGKENLRLTHGTPAVMPMYNAARLVCDEITELAREMFR